MSEQSCKRSGKVQWGGCWCRMCRPNADKWWRRALSKKARVEGKREAGNELADHLGQINREQYERRYTPDGPCSGCYDAVDSWKAAAGSSTPQETT